MLAARKDLGNLIVTAFEELRNNDELSSERQQLLVETKNLTIKELEGFLKKSWQKHGCCITSFQIF